MFLVVHDKASVRLVGSADYYGSVANFSVRIGDLLRATQSIVCGGTTDFEPGWSSR